MAATKFIKYQTQQEVLQATFIGFECLQAEMSVSVASLIEVH